MIILFNYICPLLVQQRDNFRFEIDRPNDFVDDTNLKPINRLNNCFNYVQIDSFDQLGDPNLNSIIKVKLSFLISTNI